RLRRSPSPASRQRCGLPERSHDREPASAFRPRDEAASVEHPRDGERSDGGRGDEHDQVLWSRDSLELRASLAHLDEADRSDGRAASTTPARAFLTLPAARAATTPKPEPRLRHGNDGKPVALNGLTEDTRSLCPLTDRLPNPFE